MLLSLLAACAPLSLTPAADAAATTEIVIKGSDSEVNVVQRLAEEFMKKRPDVRISVTGGGSGTGIAALLDGTCTLANSSRDLKAEEKVKFQQKGLTPIGFVDATDAVGFVVHPSNGLKQLDLAALGALFRGETTNWKTVGGADKAVGLYGRQSSSGTYDYVKSTVLKGDYSPNLKQMNGNAQIVEGVAADVSGIGYTAAGYLHDRTDVKPLLVVNDKGEATSPLDQDAVLGGRYPVARPLYQFMTTPPTGALEDFLAYEVSAEGQAIVVAEGFYPVMESRKAGNNTILGTK